MNKNEELDIPKCRHLKLTNSVCPLIGTYEKFILKEKEDPESIIDDFFDNIYPTLDSATKEVISGEIKKREKDIY